MFSLLPYKICGSNYYRDVKWSVPVLWICTIESSKYGNIILECRYIFACITPAQKSIQSRNSDVGNIHNALWYS